MEKQEHDCIQEKRLTRIELDLEKEAKKHEDLKETINGKLDRIWTAIQEGDDKNTKYIFLTVGIFLGAIMTLLCIIIAFFR